MAQNDACVIGATVTIAGRIAGDRGLQVAGVVEGSVSLSGDLVVELGGRVKADVAVNRLVVRGELSGSIEARESVVLESGARVVGDIRTPRLAIHEGAAFRGAVEMDMAPGAGA